VSTPIRVAIADDQKLFCFGIEMLIESQDDLEFVGAAFDGPTAVELAARVAPDIFLMDVRMPGLDGIAATRAIVDGSPTPPSIIVLTTYQRDVAVLQAINAGASGFIMKDTTPEFLLASIRTVYSGQSVLAPNNTMELIRGLSAPERPVVESAIESLSAREREVFLFAARVLSNADIAGAAFIGETTVKSHISSILSKLGMTSRVQLVAHAYENGLIR
jgi:DNA-binding NarL/FixJ family response regulator